jgi:type IV conjugative transfer system protein TraE
LDAAIMLIDFMSGRTFMNIAGQIKLNERLKLHRKRLLIVCGLMLVSNVLLCKLLFRQDTNVILVPTHINKDITLTTGSAYSSDYLELITRDYIGLILNLTPENYEYAQEAILKNTHPSSHGVIKHELGELAEDIKKRSVAINFRTTDMVVDLRRLQVDVRGSLETKVGLKTVSKELRKYRIVYDYMGSKLTLKEFYEVKDESL